MTLRIGSTLAITLLALFGCASGSQRPTAEFAKAQTLIDQAETAGAQRYAAAELNLARSKLKLAKAAERDGKHDLARQRATEAAADAELAHALSTTAEAQHAAQEVNQGTTSLREEAQRDTTPNPSP